MTLTFTDDNATCSVTQNIGPLNACSSDCLISLDQLDFTCDDNGTGTDPSDDFYSFSINASAINGSIASNGGRLMSIKIIFTKNGVTTMFSTQFGESTSKNMADLKQCL